MFRSGAWIFGLALAVGTLAQGCSGNNALQSACTSNRDCSPTAACVSGRCAPKKPRPTQGCRNDMECGSGKFCEIATGQCKPLSAGDPDTGPSTGDPDSGVIDDPLDGAPRDAMPTPDTAIDAAADTGVRPDARPNPDATPLPDAMPGRDAMPPDTGMCARDPDCGPPARVCQNTACVPGCGQPGGIMCTGATPRCNTGTGRCEAPPPCTVDGDCSAPTPICASMRCVPRCDAAGGACTGTNVCNPATGHCLPGQLNQNDACTIDTQCQTRLCLRLTQGMTMRAICSDPCGRTSDCPVHFSCTSVSGMGFCLHESLFGPPAPSFSTPPGGVCSSTMNTCQSGWCNTATNRCMSTCGRPGDCTAADGSNCYTYAHSVMTGTAYDELCYAPTTGSAVGAACNLDSDCRTGVCNGATHVCARACCALADCGANESCSIYGISATSGIKICTPRGGTGSGALGSTCTMPSDCRSEVCVPIRPNDMASPRQCSTTCCRNSDCNAMPGGGVCRPFGGPIMNTLVGACIPGN